MFYFLKGALALLKPSFAVIDAGGVGYKVTIGERTYAALSGKSEASSLPTLPCARMAWSLPWFELVCAERLQVPLWQISTMPRTSKVL